MITCEEINTCKERIAATASQLFIKNRIRPVTMTETAKNSMEIHNKSNRNIHPTATIASEYKGDSTNWCVNGCTGTIIFKG